MKIKLRYPFLPIILAKTSKNKLIILNVKMRTVKLLIKNNIFGEQFSSV